MTLTAEIWELKYCVIVHASEMTPLASLAHSHFGKSLLKYKIFGLNSSEPMSTKTINSPADNLNYCSNCDKIMKIGIDVLYYM